jgi:hypothetical protein
VGLRETGWISQLRFWSTTESLECRNQSAHIDWIDRDVGLVTRVNDCAYLRLAIQRKREAGSQQDQALAPWYGRHILCQVAHRPEHVEDAKVRFRIDDGRSPKRCDLILRVSLRRG